MPNWVFNSLVVSGEQAELDRLQAQLNKPYVTNFPTMNFNNGDVTTEPDVQVYSNPVFSFRNVIAPPLENSEFAEEYYGVEAKTKTDLPSTDPNWWKDVVTKMKTSNHWYDWNVTNWGTKWDIGVRDDDKYPDTILEITDEGDVMYRFNTAWSPVTEVISELSEMYPSLSFDYEYEEEQGWGGKEVYEGGSLVSEEHWDIPQSHADEHSNRGYCSRCEDDTHIPDSWLNITTLEELEELFMYEVWADCPVAKKLQETLDFYTTSVVE